MQILMSFEKKHLRRMMHLIPLLMLALYHPHCAKAIDPDDLPRIELTAENIISKEVWLRVKFVNVREPWEFVVERDGKQIAGGRMQKTDTLMIDTTATPKRLHRYKVIQLEGNVRTLESDEFEVMTLDTTSHAVQWIVDTLGVRGTIYDVWAFSKDNIWVVGEMYLKDSTGKSDPVLYNLGKWNGQGWEISRVYYGQTGLSPIRTIFAFEPNDLWIGYTQPMHWNGSEWQKYDVPSTVFSAYIYKLWGSNSSNVHMVGTNGSIAHFNGTSWRKMESGTTVDLQDVWGTDATHVWATGTTTQNGRSVVLFFDGGYWVTLYDNVGKAPQLNFQFSSVWTEKGDILYLVGGSRLRVLNLMDGRFQQTHSLGDRYKYGIRGVMQNDIFDIGSGSEVIHYNGSTWRLDPQVIMMGGGSSFWYAVQPHNDLVVIGGEFFTGLFGVPIVLRGLR